MPTKKETDEKNTVKKTTKKATTTKKKDITINDIPSDLLAALTQQITQQVMESLNQPKDNNVVNEVVKKNEKYNKAMLNNIRDEIIAVTAFTDSIIYHSPKTNMNYYWSKAGDSELLTIDEVLTMEGSSERFLHTPWLRVNDKRIIQAFGLEKLYKVIDVLDDIDKLITLNSEEIKSLFDNINKNYKDSFKQDLYNKLYNKIKNNELTDLRVIIALQEALDLDLKSLIE